MSFSSETKKELSKLPLKSKIESLLELSAMARMGGGFTEGGKNRFRFYSETKEVILRLQDLINYLYGKRQGMDQLKQGGLSRTPLYFIDLVGDDLEEFLGQAGFDVTGQATESLDRIQGRLRAKPNAQAYLRGAFMAAGSIVDPHKSYHLEIFSNRPSLDPLLTFVFDILGLPVKSMNRRRAKVYYLKRSEDISNFLVDIGASSAMLKLEDAKAMKDLRNKVNRQVNAETANLSKQVDAATRQTIFIEEVDQKMGLEKLPKSLREVARMRLAYPTYSLAQLGQLMDPPIGKSGIRHRLNKIEKIAEELREKDEKDEGR